MGLFLDQFLVLLLFCFDLVLDNGLFQAKSCEGGFLLLLSLELEDDGSLVDLFVDEEVCTLRLSPPVLSSETIGLDVSGIVVPDPFVIELNPLVLAFLDV